MLFVFRDNGLITRVVQQVRYVYIIYYYNTYDNNYGPRPRPSFIIIIIIYLYYNIPMRIVNKKQKKRHSVVGGRDGPRWRRCWTAERSGAVASSRSRGLRCAPGRGERDEKRAAITVAAVDVY